MWFYIFGSILFLIAILWMNRPKRPPNFPPGPPTLLWFGNADIVWKNLHQPATSYTSSLMEKYGDIFSIVMPTGQLLVNLTTYDNIREMCLRAEFSGRRSGVAALTRSYMKRLGIILTEGPSWVEHRRFVLKQLRNFGFGKNTLEVNIHGELQKLFVELDSLEDRPISVISRFNLPVLNVLWSMVGGSAFDSKDPVSEQCVETVKNFFKFVGPQNPIEYFPWLRFICPKWSGYTGIVEHRDFTSNLLKSIIKNHRTTLDRDNPRDFIDCFLMEMEKPGSEEKLYTEENLCIICMDLFVAGMETTSTTLSWAILLLVYYPEIQHKVQQEIDSVIGPDRLPTEHDKEHLPYTRATMLEVLRRSALVPRGLFHKALQDTEFRGFNIPKNTLMITHLAQVLLSKKHWKDPMGFCPEHFLNQDGTLNANNVHLIPFGIGRRFCLGEALAKQELFYFFTSLLQRYSFTAVDRQSLSLEPMPGIVTQPKMFNVKLKLRNKFQQ